MKRAELQWLTNWKGSPNRKPLLIRGARQVGKTWLMKEFGRQYYQQVAYINLEEKPVLKNVFKAGYDINRILTSIRIETKLNVESHNTLIILDEIQESPEAITALKYFQENAPEYHVMAAGSLLGVALAQHSSFPVGKVEFLDLYPLDYLEFLVAMGDQALAELIRNKDWALIQTFRERFIERLKEYYYVGGMPEVVSSFARQGDLKKAREIQKRILISYEQDFAKHAQPALVPRIRMIWNAIPAQLGKENRKFIYGQLRQGARAKEFELAISWLIDCGLLHKVTNVNKPALSLKAYEETNVFKLFMVDTGLLTAMSDLDIKTILEGNLVFTEFKGALTEQYVLQQLRSLKNLAIHYWSPGQSVAEIDFIVQSEGRIIPIEVKAEENLKAKSLRVYCEKYKPELAIRTSMSDYREEEWMINMPLYTISQFTSYQKKPLLATP